MKHCISCLIYYFKLYPYHIMSYVATYLNVNSIKSFFFKEFSFPRTCRFETHPSLICSKIGMNAGGAHFLQLHPKNKYGDPHWNLDITKGHGNGKFVPCNEFLLLRFFFIYFPIAGVKNSVHYTEEFLVYGFHCILIHNKNTPFR